MQIVINPERKDWSTLLQRPYVDNAAVLQSVTDIITAVKNDGDEALRRFSKEFDQVSIEDFAVRPEELQNAGKGITIELKQAIQQAKKNIEEFHSAQFEKKNVVETMPGVQCWRKSVGIEKVGLYIPGGTAPLFSTVLMLGAPAFLAGCKQVVLCTPCDKNGKINEAILYAAKECGITQVFKIGGAQAIAAMAFGTETIPGVYKIFGPGNQYVTAAKQLIQMQGIAIDMPAGPSEVCILADESAKPSFVAADLLSQAEHGADSQVLLITTSQQLVEDVLKEIEQQLETLPRKNIAEKALKNSKALVVTNIMDGIDLANEYAAEHLILCCKLAESVAEQIVNAGSVFIGNYSPESVGDYASGTNHTLPTNAFARAYSGVSMDSFMKKITFQRLNKEGLQNIGNTVIEMAEAEGLVAHANAVRVRLAHLNPPGGRTSHRHEG
jgi:histidinol dehydrogenase